MASTQASPGLHTIPTETRFMIYEAVTPKDYWCAPFVSVEVPQTSKRPSYFPIFAGIYSSLVDSDVASVLLTWKQTHREALLFWHKFLTAKRTSPSTSITRYRANLSPKSAHQLSSDRVIPQVCQLSLELWRHCHPKSLVFLIGLPT